MTVTIVIDASGVGGFDELESLAGALSVGEVRLGALCCLTPTSPMPCSN